jgi:hypothetical protein
MLMFTRGYAKHPRTQSVYSQGFAVGHVRRYGCVYLWLQRVPMWIKVDSITLNLNRYIP